MDIAFTEQELAFQREVRTFLAEAWDAELQQKIECDYKSGAIEWQRRINARGWMAPGWPAEYGGADWTATQHYIWDTERANAGAPVVVTFGVNMVGPVIYTFGSEEQKKRFLPRILNSDDWWCQGYSEPGAGSDLASLRTRAVREGEDYIINGAKIWTSYAQLADWIFCLVRTDSSGRKQEGISFILIDMKSPGVTVNPIRVLEGGQPLNEVQFDNVRVPAANLIGKQDMGWTYAKSLLSHERMSMSGVADCKRILRQIRELASMEQSGGKRVIDEPVFRLRLSEIEIELMAFEYTELRVLASTSAGEEPGTESSLLKLKGTELQQSLQQLFIDLSGSYCGVIQADLESRKLGHEFADQARRNFMEGRAASIYGGSNEIQKNIIARRVLDL